MPSLEAERTQDLTQKSCDHCGLNITYLFNDEAGHSFCCAGCRSVYGLLQAHNLGEYYKYKNEFSELTIPATEKGQSFQHFESENFLNNYSKKESDSSLSVHFYLEGVHCIACLWLLEKLPQLDPQIISSRLNLSTSTLKVTIQKGASFAKVAMLLNKLGYRPFPLRDENDQEKMILQEDRSLLLKIGVSAAASMNVMIYAIGIYGGADGIYAESFNLINLALTLPVVFYSAIPFYKSAWRGLLAKSISIDLPIAIAILTAFFVGVANTLMRYPDNYFDSVCVLVFLLLSSRYILRKAQHRSLNKIGLRNLLSNQAVTKLVDGNEILISENELAPKDIVRIKTNDVLPVDGVVVRGNSSLNKSSLTGESRPEKISIGQRVFAGSTNIGPDFDLEVQEIGNQTRMGKIYQQIEDGWSVKAPISNRADQISKVLVWSVLAIALTAFGYHLIVSDWHKGLNVALAIVIVTCPCALGLATPLAFIRSLSLAAKKNIFIKNESILERLTHAETFVFDKTGTLTLGHYGIVDAHFFTNDIPHILQIILTLEWNSQHPIAQAFKEYIGLHLAPGLRAPLPHATIEELSTKGLFGSINNQPYSLEDVESESNQKMIALKSGELLLATFVFQDSLKSDSRKVVQSLKDRNYSVVILSGDNESQVAKIGKELDVPSHSRHSQVSPELKNDFLNSIKNPVMIGDGANDAMAISHSLVGISLKGSVEAALKASDVHISDLRLIKVIELLDISGETLFVVKRNLAFSLTYNLLGLSLALLGFITPLWGAVLMPLSSLTVLFSTILGTKRLRQLGRP